MRLIPITLCAAALALAASCGSHQEYKTDSLGVEVTAEQNREYSYTDKQAGYWYGTTHQKELQ